MDREQQKQLASKRRKRNLVAKHAPKFNKPMWHEDKRRKAELDEESMIEEELEEWLEEHHSNE